MCYGKSIKQYRLVNGQVIRPVVRLGEYSAVNSTDKLEYLNWPFNKNRKTSLTFNNTKPKQLFYTQNGYNNGNICDATGLPRRTTVRFTCDPILDDDRIIRVDEIKTCQYILTISTKKLCAIHGFQTLKN